MGRSKKSSSGKGLTSLTSSSSVLVPEQNIMQPEVKPDPDRPGRSTNQLAFIYKNVMPALFKLKNADAFKDPVNPHRLKLLNYYTFIKNPMDLKTIRERLRNNYYQSSSECIRDFQLMFCNTIVYNKPDTPVVLQANELEAAFLLKLLEMPKEEVEGTGFTKHVATPVKQEAVMDVEPLKRSSARSTKAVNRYTPPASTVLAIETETPKRKKKRATSSSSSGSSSSASMSSSSSSSSSSSDSCSSDSEGGKRENSQKNKILHKVRGIDAKIYKLEKQKKKLMKKLEKVSTKEDKKKSRKIKKKGRKRKISSASSKPEEITAKPEKKKSKAALPAPVPKKTPVTAAKGKGKSAGGQPDAITTQDRVELRENLGKLKTSDLSMLMGIVGSTDEIDVGAMEPEQFQVVKRFVKSKLAKGRIATTPSPSVSPPSSPERLAPMTNGVAHATLPVATETLESPGSPGSDVPFYDSEDERLLNTY